MNPVSFHSFADELQKIAGMIREGWEFGSENYPSSIPKPMHGWVGTGPKSVLGAPPSLGQKVMGLGGLTRYLPVGPKALTVAFTAPEVISALKQKDPMGMERSRAERMSNVAGATIGGLAGTGLARRLLPGGLGFMIGGMGGSMLGSRVSNLPFIGTQRRREAAMMAQQAGQGAPTDGVVR